MKITKRQLRRIIREERGEYVPPSPPGPGPDVEKIEKIAGLMTSDPDFKMFRKHVDKFRVRAQATSAENALMSVLPEYMPGSLISDLLAKANGPYEAKEKVPHPLDGIESDYDSPISGDMREMKITKRQLRRIIKEEKAKLQEYGGRPYDPTVPGDYERYRDNPTGDAPIGGAQDAGETDVVDDYIAWAEENGHVTPAASSVVASYIVDDPKREGSKVVLADAFGMMVSEITREVERQQAEKAAMMGEGVSHDSMPDSWRRILGNCLGDK